MTTKKIEGGLFAGMPIKGRSGHKPKPKKKLTVEERLRELENLMHAICVRLQEQGDVADINARRLQEGIQTAFHHIRMLEMPTPFDTDNFH